MTNRMEDNYEITPEAQDYNNDELEETKSEIKLDDSLDGVGTSFLENSDPFDDPYARP